MYKGLIDFSIVSLLLCLLFFAAPNLPYSNTVQNVWHWDVLWRNQLFKQISGFSILGFFSVGLLVSVRKRIRKLDKLGKFDYWRLAHISLGLLVIVTLIAHTGFRLGNGLNSILMVCFCFMLIVGAFSTGIIGYEHKLSNALSTRIRKFSIYSHIILF